MNVRGGLRKAVHIKLEPWKSSMCPTWRLLQPTWSFQWRISCIPPGRACRRNYSNQSSHAQPPESLQLMKSSLEFVTATHEIKDLNKALLDQDVVIHGYLGARADLSKNFCFAPIHSKDLVHRIQIVSHSRKSDGGGIPAHDKLKFIECSSPVAVRGTVRGRLPSKEGYKRDDMLRDVEIELKDIHCFNLFPKDIIVTETTRFPLEQRHLQLRTSKELRQALVHRAQAIGICRDELNHQGFLEVETPLLFKSTPEGAREFLVPTRQRGLMYALPQSPQQYKQILMASGIPKYYQVAKCFRDEDMRADRQPEFTQLDLEMSFASAEDVMNCIENLIRRLWRDILKIESLPGKFPRMTYEEAMSKYGSDKPDVRLGMEIVDVSPFVLTQLASMLTPIAGPIVEAIKIHISDDLGTTQRAMTEFMDSPKSHAFRTNPDGAPGFFIVNSKQPQRGLAGFGFEGAERLDEILDLEDGDLVVVQARKNTRHFGGSTSLGRMRLAMYDWEVENGRLEYPKKFDFLWVHDFPLFSPPSVDDPSGAGQHGDAGFDSTHHPFTSPKTAQDIDLLLTDPLAVRGDHYDLVLNGVELGGGSRRIHSAKLQEFIMTYVLKMKPNRLAEFSHLIEVLRAGCPPHAGIALGFDRLMQVMLGRESLRDVIAFPKSAKGQDLLVNSPSPVQRAALEQYHLRPSDEQPISNPEPAKLKDSLPVKSPSDPFGP